MTARFERGTFRRIALVLDESESRTDFVRVAVENEIERRFDRLRENAGQRDTKGVAGAHNGAPATLHYKGR
jgi:hypothetical protein